MRLLVTGGAGFIGSNFVRYVLERHPDCRVVNFDKLTYAGNLENLSGIADESRHEFVHGDICDAAAVDRALDAGIDAVVNFAAESHVDRSILEGIAFVETNVKGTYTLLEAARRRHVPRFVQISTDEVYGSLGASGFFTEDSPLAPNSPYAASKASADLLVRSFHATYGFPGLITRCSNNYGPYQFPEKLIPLLIVNAMAGRPLPMYGDGLYVRDWIHVRDHCSAINAVLRRGEPGRVYNIGSRSELPNIEIARIILECLHQPESLIEFVPDRPGHDRRYAIDPSRLEKELGWKPEVGFQQGLRETIEWYRSNGAWVDRVRSGEYLKYYERMYNLRSRTLSEL